MCVDMFAAVLFRLWYLRHHCFCVREAAEILKRSRLWCLRVQGSAGWSVKLRGGFWQWQPIHFICDYRTFPSHGSACNSHNIDPLIKVNMEKQNDAEWNYSFLPSLCLSASSLAPPGWHRGWGPALTDGAAGTQVM